MDEKQKNDEQPTAGDKAKKDERKVEWSFDFGEFGKSFNRMLSNMAGEETLKTESFVEPLGEAQAAIININFAVGRNFISALDGGDNLLEATLHYVGEIIFEAEAGTEKVVTLKQDTPQGFSDKPLRQGIRAFASRDDLRWDVGLSPAVPLVLNVEGGVGPTQMNLTGLQVREVEVSTGVGTLSVTLPQQAERIYVDLDAGVGQTRVYVPAHTPAEIDVDGGVGAVEIVVAPGSAVYVEADQGLGSINVPKHYKRLGKEGFGEDKVWQTEGYDLAEQRIIIRYDGGVGQFTLREAELV